ncbi:ABC transporter permease [Candidatus Saccharibacteria bacterium]|nr:ABC transporter permease [Candidatus Saccharibacteria bacterium]
MALLIKTHYALAKESIRQNRTRSFLTCLGIAIGVASIILIMSLAGSINHMIATQVKSLGADLLVVRPVKHNDVISGIVDSLTASNQYLASNLTLNDAKAIAALDDVTAAAPIALSVGTLTSEDKLVPSASVVGTTGDLAKIQNLQLKNGTFLSDKVENAAVVGRNLSLELFGTSQEAVGKTFTMLEHKFIVVGMLEEIEDPINFNNVDFDNSVLVSAEYLSSINAPFQVQQINVKAANTSVIPALTKEMKAMLDSEKSGDMNYRILAGDEISHPAGGLFDIVSGMLTLVAGVSLVVGGIGVMNILLVSVAERTREIGIRKAVGASGINILIQFLFESLILTLAGGMLGIVVGYTLAFLVSVVTPFSPYIDLGIIAIAVGTSLAIGLIFGIYPAIKAARKDPIESLRYYR